MKVRTAIFGVYVAASALGFAVMVGLVLRDVRFRYVESMRRTLGDTAAFLAAFVAEGTTTDERWAEKLSTLPPSAELLRVFATDANGVVIFDSAHGRDVGQIYSWPKTGGGRVASENYSMSNVNEVDGELRVAAPVRRAGKIVGRVGVGRPLTTVTEGVRKARSHLIWTLGSVAAVMVAAGWWIASKLTHSLERLTQYVEAVRDGQVASPPPSRATEIQALGRAFEEMRTSLEGKAHVERYTQALAHEFKAPLSAIRGAAELLDEKMPQEERARFIGNVRAESERLQRLVDRMLDLSALEARNGRLDFAEIDLRPLMDDVIGNSATVASQRGVGFVFRGTANPRVRGERFLLTQAVGNLVHNAVEFSPSGGVIELDLRFQDHTAVISVEDSGPGVPGFALEKVFDRFYSLPRPDSGRKSSGLGLSIVREIAHLHGGDARLENRPGKGARAILVLPVL